MIKQELISIQTICDSYDVPFSFFEDLRNYEIISLQEEGAIYYIEENTLPQVERIMRLHFDLHINMEGIDVIINLLNKIDQLEKQNNILKNDLQFYRKDE